jgi:hypothetical protein
MEASLLNHCSCCLSTQCWTCRLIFVFFASIVASLLPARSVCMLSLAPHSAISLMFMAFPQLLLSVATCPLLSARLGVEFEMIYAAHTDYMSWVWPFAVCFLFSLACWLPRRKILLIPMAAWPHQTFSYCSTEQSLPSEPRSSEELPGFMPGQICKAWGMLSL